MNARSHKFRLRAIDNEQRARAAPDPLIKAEWEALAIEWHALANPVSQSSDSLLLAVCAAGEALELRWYSGESEKSGRPKQEDPTLLSRKPFGT